MADIVDIRGSGIGQSGSDSRAGRAFADALRIAEALVFASAEPVAEKAIARKLPQDTDVPAVMNRLAEIYAPRGVNLVRVQDHWAFRTAADLAFVIHDEKQEVKRLSRAALEVLAIIAYHQPVTRAEIEEVRGVATSKGTLDVLLETAWVRLRGRRRTPGRPVTYGTTPAFLDHFSLEDLSDLPGVDELRGAGLLSGQLPAGFRAATLAGEDLAEEEDPITQLDLEELGLLSPRDAAQDQDDET
jgi:segregation and condensation protein B